MPNLRQLIQSLSLFTAALISSLSLASPTQSASPIRIMSYNVENLFDTNHDQGKSDWAYLPLARKNTSEVQEECGKVSNPYWQRECFELDWNQRVLRNKVHNLGRVIRSAFNGQGPDIIVLQEVENMAALTELTNNGLQGMGYETLILLEGPDVRGIDTAIISRFPLDHSTSHVVQLPTEDGKPRPTRNILEASFKVRGKTLTVFSNHWPSQASPTPFREAAARTLIKAAINADRRGEHVMALGDFNSLRHETDGPIGQILRGSRNELMVDGIEHRLDPRQNFRPTSKPGTHWYRGSWSFLDRIYVMRSSVTKGLKVDWQSIDAHGPSFMMQGNRPYRFDAEEADGFSDHLPLVVEVEL